MFANILYVLKWNIRVTNIQFDSAVMFANILYVLKWNIRVQINSILYILM